MKKILLPFLLAILCLAACEKKEDAAYYDRFYGLYYYPQFDSFSAMASFRRGSTTATLYEFESISLNGRSQDYIDKSAYYWTGKGKPDASFSFKKPGKVYSDVILASEIGDYELIVPDTVHKSKGFTIRIKNYIKNESKFAALNLDAQKFGWGLYINADSSFIPSSKLIDLPDQKFSITYREHVMKYLQRTNTNDVGNIYYWAILTKDVYLVD